MDEIDCSRLPNKLMGELGEMYVIDKLLGLGYKNIEQVHTQGTLMKISKPRGR